ncbi:23S rRNA (guanosine(2251)-2'-O)-methyltransferase RlmB [Bdellovibrionota bacterium FG-1]
MALQVRNPHSVLAALETRPHDVTQITVPASLTEREQKGGSGVEVAVGRDAWLKVIQVARAKGVKVISGGAVSSSRPSRGERRTETGEREAGGRTGVAEATLQERQGVSAEELFRGARERAEGKGLWLALDSLTDPHNVGAIFRAASFFGVQGILLTQERSAPLSSAVYDVASGGVEYVPFTLQTNLQRAFEVAKDSGLWILGTSEHAKQSFRTVERDRPWLLVVGNEEKGMRRLTEESCDVTCKIPAQGQVTSLNVSVATGILISALSP